jgi:hypothetical protein
MDKGGGISPLAIVAAVIVLLAVVFGLYRWQFGKSAPGSAGDVQPTITGPPGKDPNAPTPVR